MSNSKIKNNLFLCVFLAIFASSAYAEVSADNIDEIIATFQSEQRQKIQVTTDELGFSGITDERLFDVIEQRLLSRYQKGGRDEELFTGWLIKALSYSGNKKYLPTLEKISNTQARLFKVKRYANNGIEELERYSRWNPDIGKDLAGLSGAQLSRKRTANMLNSSHTDLVLVGFKRVYNLHPYNAALAELVAGKLASANVHSQDQADFVSWSMKALSRSGIEQHKTTLEKFANDRLLPQSARKHARNALKLITQEIPRYKEVNDNPENLTGEQLEQQHIKNMLQSKDSYLVREGARQIYYTYPVATELLALAEARLLERYRSSGDKQFMDAMAWLCKALAFSGDSSYEKTLQQVSASAFDQKLKKNAKKYLRHLQEIKSV